MRCLAIDDEPLALAQISGYISRVPFLTLVKACRDAFEAMEVLAEEKIDLIFVDIHMPDLNGMDFVKSLVNGPLVIFTTAYSEYAVEGFKVEAVDYLLKPFSFQDLLKAADKAHRHYEYRSRDAAENRPESPGENILFVKTEYKAVSVQIDRIRYIEGMSEYVRIFLEGEEKPVITLMSLNKLEERLPSADFMRVHRSYIVNLRRITEVSRLRIGFDKKTHVPVGDNYKEKFQEYINKRSLT